MELEPNEIFKVAANKGFKMYWGGRVYEKHNGLLLPQAHIYRLYGGFGEMIFQELNRPLYSIWFSIYDIIERLRTHATLDVRLVELSLLINGNIAYLLQPSLGNIRHKHWQFNLINSTSMDNYAQFERGDMIMTLDFHPSLVMLESLYEEFPDLMGPFLEAIYAGRDMLFFQKHLHTTVEMTKLIECIRGLIIQEDIDYDLLDRSVRLLFVMAINCKLKFHSKKYRYDRIEEMDVQLDELFRLLISDLDHFYGIKYYARQVGMNANEANLKFNCKYGQPMRKTWTNRKLFKGYGLVRDTNMTIVAIAEECGYADGAAFSTAFKRNYGFSPKYFREFMQIEDGQSNSPFF